MQKHCLICRIAVEEELPKKARKSTRNHDARNTEAEENETEGYKYYKLYEELTKILDPSRPHRLPDTEFLAEEFHILCPTCCPSLQCLWNYQKEFEGINARINVLVRTIKNAIKLQSSAALSKYELEEEPDGIFEDEFVLIKDEPLDVNEESELDFACFHVSTSPPPSPTPARPERTRRATTKFKDDSETENQDDDDNSLLAVSDKDTGSDSDNSDKDYDKKTPKGNNRIRHQCPHCQKWFPLKSKLLNHFKSHHPEFAEDSNKEVKNKGRAKIEPGDGVFTCKLCQKTFNREIRLSTHFKRIHEKIRRHACTSCPMKFFEKKDLDRHKRKHTGEKPFQCKVCHNKFTRKDCMLEHQRRVCGLPDPDNPDNSEEFPEGLQITPKTPKLRKRKSEKSTEESEKKENILCHLCPGQFPSERMLATHVKKEHDGDIPFPCPKCPNRFFSKGNLNRHLLTHVLEEASNEEENNSTASQSFEHLCKFCKIPFKSRSSMLGHVQRFHPSGGVPDFKCTTCFKTFKSTRDLTRHIRLHTGEKPFSCEKCGKKFSRRDYVLGHRRTNPNCKKEPEDTPAEVEDQVVAEVPEEATVSNDNDGFNPAEIFN